MNGESERPLTLDAASFGRVRDFAAARDMDPADALSLVVHQGVEDQERRDAVHERLEALQSSFLRLHQLIDVGLGPRIFAIARLLAAREGMVTEAGVAEEDFLAATLVMGRFEWDGFTADLEAVGTEAGRRP